MRVLLIFKDSVAVDRLALMQLSAVLKADDHEVKLAILGIQTEQQIATLLTVFRPAVVGYSAMTGEHVTLLDLNRAFKKTHEFLAVFGGPHATFRHDLIEEDGVDAICIGEGDIVFPEFCRRVENGTDYWRVSNFLVKHEGQIVRNPRQDLVPDLDMLPMPDRSILYDVDPNMATSSLKYFMAARGCPYRCSYCFNARFNADFKDNGKVVRTRSPETVIQEIEWVRARYPLEHVGFLDDVFILKPREWVDEFCRLYRQRINLPFSATVRANSVREDIIAKFAAAGLSFVWMGVESGNETVANEILHRDLNNAQVVAAAEIIKKHGVGLVTQNLIGLPVGDPFAVDLETLDLNIRIAPSFGWSSILYPYPGSPIEEIARRTGHLKGKPVYLTTNKRSSMLDFGSERIRRRLENLHKLFGIVVRFPALRPYITFLCDLPFGFLYRAIFYAWYGYSYRIKLAPSKRLRQQLPYLLRVFGNMLLKS